MKTYKDFPSTRFQGSKRRLLPWLAEILGDLEFESCLDLFGGTGAVSYLFKTQGKSVTYNDYLRSNYIAARAIIVNGTTTLKESDFNYLFEGYKAKGIVSELFSGIFFTDEENLEIDSIIHQINSGDVLRGFKRDIALFSLYQALLMKRPFNLFHRANLNLRLSNVKRSFGNKKTWDTPIRELMNRIRTEANNSVFDNFKKNVALNKDALAVKAGFDLVYLDPPYYSFDKKYSPSYFEFYHFLEGLSDYPRWRARIDFSRKCLPISNKDASFTRKSFTENLEELLEIHRESVIALSYKSPGYPSIESLKEILEKTHKKISIHSKQHSYSLNKNNGHYAENLIIAYPRN